jgi:class III lanthionine synthetase
VLPTEFLLADPVFFEALDRLDDRADRFALAAAVPPSGWTRHERGVWVCWQPDGVDLPAQGWKIHVSATLAGAEHTVSLVAGYCTAARVPFKFLRSRDMVVALNAKYTHRGSSGKLLTLYPPTDDSLHRTLVELSARLAGRPGPYILSDLRWEAGPLYLRYGGFVDRYCLSDAGELVPAVAGPDGRPVPDVRDPVFRPPAWVPLPAFLSGYLARSAGEAVGRFPFEIQDALHFSNGGGVYRALDPRSGRQVVLREARPHAGLDSAGLDAVARLDREHRALQRLAGLDVVPALVDRFTVWEHEYLAQEFIDGDLLYSAVAMRHPLIYPDATAAEVAGYTDWALATVAAVEEAVAQVHDRGVVYGDLHPHNIMVRPDGRVVLLDFEQASGVDEDWEPGLGAHGFCAPWARRGTAADRYASACLRLAVFVPLTSLLTLAPNALRRLVDIVTERFPVPPDFGPRLLADLTPPGRPADAAPHPEVPDERDLAAAIMASATPDREDRLFPGDVAQFAEAGVSLAHGAAGVLWALQATGAYSRAELTAEVDWLARAARRMPVPLPGLYQGVHGVAYVLDRFGRHGDAIELLDRAGPLVAEVRGPGLFHGLAGIGLALLHFAVHSRRFLSEATGIGARLRQAVRGDAAGLAPVGIGLRYGWSGIAAFLVRLYEVTGDAGFLDDAEAAVRRDLTACGVAAKDTLQVQADGLLLLYLGTGSAGIGIALHEVLAHRPAADLAAARRQILSSMRAELVREPGLFEGRAGFVVAADHLSNPEDKPLADAVVDGHVRRLGWHAVPYRGHVAFPGHQLLRLSMDLATGTAGVLLALSAGRTRPGGALPLLGREGGETA